ncbi:hypothetical protein K474DRAFT_1704543 [Panus rudis PR-1116 ss-1]|nr:hypothetical protein K474DRAFT_1704543 [Panus rudis PR-1116 ss-1]
MWKVIAVTFDPTNVAKYETKAYRRTLDMVDAQCKQKLCRYYRREDTFRGLVGRLLPMTVLKEHGISPRDAVFKTTPSGKPYIETILPSTRIGYNVSHDNGVIAMVFAAGEYLDNHFPAYRLGVDVMRVELPDRHTLHDYFEIFSEQLTDLEQTLLIQSPPLEQSEALRRFYLMWTLKEAYTKALGIGLGFDFRRIEYDVVHDTVRIDGNLPIQWEFVRFDLTLDEGGVSHTYVGVASREVEGIVQASRHESRSVVPVDRTSEWLQLIDASDFLEHAVEFLS